MLKKKGKVSFLGRFVAMVMTVVLLVTVMPVEAKADECSYTIIFENITDTKIVDILQDYYYFMDLTNDKTYDFEREANNKLIIRNLPTNIIYFIMSKDGLRQNNGQIGIYNTTYRSKLSTMYFYDGTSLVDTKYMMSFFYVYEECVYEPKREGYIFAGWELESGEVVNFPVYAGYDGIVDHGGSVNLYASWEAHEHDWDEDNWEYNNEAHWHECLTDKCPIEENTEKDGYEVHEMGQWTTVTEETFKEDGLKERKCQICDYKEQEIIPKLSDSHIHDFNGREEMVEEPKCYEFGLKNVYCTLEECGAYEEQIIEKVPHDYEEEWRYDNVNHYHKCKNCEDCIDNENHHMTEWVVVDESTFSEDGLKERECKTCGYEEEQRIPKLSEGHIHDFNGKTEYVKEPKCYEEGLEYVYCTLDGCEAYEERNIEKKPHDYEEEWRYSDAIHYHKCKNCENISDEELHHMTEWQVVDVQTYAIKELEERHCIKCEYSEERTVEKPIPEHKHEYTGREEIVTDPTCTQEGVMYIYCNGDECEFFIEENIPKVDHDYEVGWFYNEEIHYHKCKNCEHHIDDEVHIMFETNMVKLATKDLPGIMELECTRCGYVDYEEVPYVDLDETPEKGETFVEEESDVEGNNDRKDDEEPPFTVPQTDDVKVIHIYATLAMISGMTYLLYYFRPINMGISMEKKKELVDKLIKWAKSRNRLVKVIALVGIMIILFYYHVTVKISKTEEKAWQSANIL